jgi:hypothetical protein
MERLHEHLAFHHGTILTWQGAGIFSAEDGFTEKTKRKAHELEELETGLADAVHLKVSQG